MKIKDHPENELIEIDGIVCSYAFLRVMLNPTAKGEALVVRRDPGFAIYERRKDGGPL